MSFLDLSVYFFSELHFSEDRVVKIKYSKETHLTMNEGFCHRSKHFTDQMCLICNASKRAHVGGMKAGSVNVSAYCDLEKFHLTSLIH